MHSTHAAYLHLEQRICPALDDLLRETTLTTIERQTIRRSLAMLEEILGDVQEREREQMADVCEHDHN